jgi:putative DNA primase/helicase
VLQTTPGYHPNTKLWLHQARGFTLEPLSNNPSPEDIESAKRVILEDVFGDFPFDGDASRAHAVAALILSFVREMVEGSTPLHIFDAPTPGTGKTLLVEVIALVGTGRHAEVMAEGQDDDEWRKRLTAVLLKAPGFVVIDNVRRLVDSSALAMALTATTWSDRILGKSAIVTLPVRTVWLATGNNIALSHEMARRSVSIRVDAKRDKPWERTKFKHPDLRTWVSAHRADVIHACLTLARAWIVAGRPPGKRRLGSYEPTYNLYPRGELAVASATP